MQVDTGEKADGNAPDVTPNPNPVIKILKILFSISTTVVMLCGLMFIIILVTYSLVSLKGAEVPDDIVIPTEGLMRDYLPYLWIGIFVIYGGGIIIKFFIPLKRGIVKYYTSENKGAVLKEGLEWLKKN